MTSRPDLEAELAELKAANEAATSWGAAVGARSERIEAIKRNLAERSSPHTRLLRERFFNWFTAVALIVSLAATVWWLS